MTQEYELRMPYGSGFLLVDEIRKLDAQAMTIETSWKAKPGLQLHLADHFPRPDKSYLPGVITIQALAESSGLNGFRIAKISGLTFGGHRPIEPGDIVLETKSLVREEPETEISPTFYQISGTVNAPKMECQLLRLETVDEPTVFLTPAMATGPDGSLVYRGTEILTPCGPNLPNTLLAEHMCQSVVAMNAHANMFEGKKFLLGGVPEAEFFSDVPWGDRVVSKGHIEIGKDPRFGTAYVETYLGDAPVAMIEITFAAVRARPAVAV